MTEATPARVKLSLRNPFFVFGLVLAWRVALLVATVQPIPANDAFFFDGAAVNWLHHGRYCNPPIAAVFPISGREVFSAYPPLYEGVLILWMTAFGTGVLASMALHLALFAAAAALTLALVAEFFPAAALCPPVVLLLLGVTFDDRPEGLAHVFGLAALLLLARMLSGRGGWITAAGVALALLCALYTSVIVGAFYFGAGGLAAAAAAATGPERTGGLRSPRLPAFIPFLAAAAAFAAVTFAIARTEPRLWQGFLENARKAPLMARGLRAPKPEDLLKLVRTAPVYLVALAVLANGVARRKKLPGGDRTWVFLTIGVLVAGGLLLAADVTVLQPFYVTYVLFTQVILAAGLLAADGHLFSAKPRRLRSVIGWCAALVAMRAAGMSTWGAACAWKNGYSRTQAVLRAEWDPFTRSDQPVLVSSAFLYGAVESGVRNPVYSDWYFDPSVATADSQFDALVRLRPPKLVLTQFDYYRAMLPMLERLRRHPELVTVRVDDRAAFPTPDSMPSLQRIVQHISWAPVLVDLGWKPLTSPSSGARAAASRPPR